MKKYRINTTISLKHYELLKKYAEKLGTQQSVLELALENLNNNSKEILQLSHEEEVWLKAFRELKGVLIYFQKDYAKILFETADMERTREYVNNEKPVEFALAYYYQKPLKECSLQEIIDAAVLNIKLGCLADSMNCTEDDDCYTINITHSMGINLAKLTIMMYESLFKSYGARFESDFSQRSIFFKIFKELNDH